MINDSEKNQKLLEIRREFLAIVLGDKNNKMKEFNKSCNTFYQEQLKNIIEDGIQKGELKEIARNFVDVFIQFEIGTNISQMIQNDFDKKEVCETFVNSLFDMLEIKK